MQNQHHTLKLLCLIVLIIALSFFAVADDRTDKIDKLFEEWDSTLSPGVAMAIIHNGEIIYERGYGMANLEHNVPIAPETVFRIGSTSKQFTAACIAILSLQGKLSLDDDIRKYLPELSAYDKPITIRHLVHHTSGIRDYLTLAYLSGKSGDDFYTPGETVAIVGLTGSGKMNQSMRGDPPGSPRCRENDRDKAEHIYYAAH